MRYIVFVFLFIGNAVSAQINFIAQSNINSDSTTRQYVQNSPTNTFPNRRDVLIMKDSNLVISQWYAYRFPLLAAKNDGSITGSLQWLDASGNVKLTPQSGIVLAQSQTIGLPDSLLNKYTKAQSDAKFYLQTNPSGFVTPSSASAFTNKTGSNLQWTNDAGYTTGTSSTAFTNKTGNISQWTNDASYLTSASISGKLDNTLTSARIFVGNGSNIAIGVAMSGDATMGNTGALTLAASGVSADTYSGVTVNTKGLVTAATKRSFNNAPSVTIQTVAAAANGNQLSSTRDVLAIYSVTMVSTASISGAASGYIVFEICPTNSTTAGDWVEVGRVPNGQAVSLAVVLQSVSTGGGQLGTVVPAGYFRRLRSVNVSGTPTYTYNSGQEVTL